jgi:hypothetical protein
VAAGVGGGLLLAGGDDDTTDGPVRAGADGAAPVRLVPVAPRGRGATGTVRLASGPGGQAEVRLTGLRPSARGDFYELWLLGEGGELISLGSFRVPGSGAAELRVPVPVDPARFRYVDVSREPADGDPAHSARSVLRGPTA